MRILSKKNAAIVLTMTLTLAMAVTVMAAPGGRGRDFGQNGQMPEFENGERPEMPEPFGDDQPQRPNMQENQGMKPVDPDIESILAAIDALEDEEVKAELMVLLDEYTETKSALDTAMEDESEDADSYRKAEMDAMKTLMEALEEAGVNIRPELPDGEAPEFEERNKPDDGAPIWQMPKENTAQKSEVQDEAGQPQASVNQEDTGFNRFINWIKSLFS